MPSGQAIFNLEYRIGRHVGQHRRHVSAHPRRVHTVHHLLHLGFGNRIRALDCAEPAPGPCGRAHSRQRRYDPFRQRLHGTSRRMMRPAASWQEYILASAGPVNEPTSNAPTIRRSPVAAAGTLVPRPTHRLWAIPVAQRFPSSRHYPRRKSKSQPRSACVMCSAYSRAYPRRGRKRRGKSSAAAAQLLVTDQELEPALLH